MLFYNRTIRFLILALFPTIMLTKHTGVFAMELTSTAFTHQQSIPKQYTCDGANLSPPLAWVAIPKNTQSLVLIVDDPDAPHGTWDHWLLFNIPPRVTEFTENLTQLPNGTKEGINSWGETGYGGPCPPSGVHRYIFTLYALDISLNIKDKPTKAELLNAMKGQVIEQTVLMGTYQRSSSR